MMTILSALILSLAPQSGEDLVRLENVNPKIRILAVKLAGEYKWIAAVPRLIAMLESPDETPEIKAAALNSLTQITERTEKDPAAWKKWWNAEGKVRIAEQGSQSDTPLTAKQEELLTKAKQDIRAITTGLAVAIILFVLVMFFFVGHVSSKIKGWRELVARAEIYIKHGQELTDRTDKIAAEIDSRKAELAAFIEKVRKEQEEEISRRGDELGSRLEHQLRMELQNLRQKAERELDQTVTDLKTQIETTARRAASEMRDRLTK